MASPLEPLERLSARARSLEEFLSRPALIDRYYEEATRFFGADRFPRPVFDRILEQLGALVRDVPEVGVRLWEPRDALAGFTIRASFKSFGRRISKRAWKVYLGNWISRLDVETLHEGSEEKNRVEAKRILDSLARSAKAFESSIEKLPRKSKETRRAGFYRELHKDRRAVSAAAWIVRYHLVTSPGWNILNCGDVDFLLNELDRWRQHPEEVGHPEIRELSWPVAELIRFWIPKQSELLKAKTLFPKSARSASMSTEKYEFFHVSRPFHAIWRGVYLNECVGGFRTDLKSNHPARWAIPAIEGAITFFVVRGSNFQGYVQLVPVTRGSEAYGSLELQVPVLAKTVRSGKNNQLPMFDLCLSELSDVIPSGWKGFLISESPNSNVSGCKDSLRKSPAYLLGEIVGGCHEFSVNDPLAERIARQSPRLGIAANYPNGLIFDANFPNSGWLHRLRIV